MLGVVLPDTCGPGGDLFALVHLPGGDVPLAVNSSGRAGSNADAAALRDRGLSEIPIQSHHTITVPGCVDGWEALLERLGTTTLGDALGPAISLAADGFPVSSELSASLGRYQDRIASQPSAFELYPDGAAPEPGAVIRRPALARTLSSLAAGGRSAFFGGEVGSAIIEVCRGAITRGDLDVVQTEWIDPLGL
ncbi:MAG: gamma-glutamyltranspeptidase, partial [Actinobacteria bacterium]